MGKYDPLYHYLKSRAEGHWRASMTDIERVLGFPLPASAKRYPAWWANQRGAAVQANSWLDAGWETSDVTPGGKVTFTRVNSGAVIAKAPYGSRPPTRSLNAVRSPEPQPEPAWTIDPAPVEPDEDEAEEQALPTDWFWEGHVVDAVERHLVGTGWRTVSKADTASKARGIDLHAERNGQVLLVEAKGYPSKDYRDPVRAGEVKSTAPTNQAQHWFSHALLKALRLQAKNTSARIALAFPDFPRYRKLFDETEPGLRKLGLVFMFVFENGRVETIGL